MNQEIQKLSILSKECVIKHKADANSQFKEGATSTVTPGFGYLLPCDHQNKGFSMEGAKNTLNEYQDESKKSSFAGC